MLALDKSPGREAETSSSDRATSKNWYGTTSPSFVRASRRSRTESQNKVPSTKDIMTTVSDGETLALQFATGAEGTEDEDEP
jgi:hypothetical protein